MAELRWNPLLNTWTMVAGNRQHRPHLPQGNCPFCAGSGKVPDENEMLVYANDFPALTQTPAQTAAPANSFFQHAAAHGSCDVVLYSHEHNKYLFQFSAKQIEKLVTIWKARTETLAADKDIKYVFPFESRGEEVGVTIHHPHGQIYAYSWLPAKLETELDNCLKYFKRNRRNLFADMLSAEKEAGTRVVFENEHFVALIPYFTDYPYGVFILAKNNVQSLIEFTPEVIADLAVCIKNVTGAFECLFNRPFPYMMCVHQSPVNMIEWADTETFYRFHIEFYPPLRAADKIKWLASSETGAGAAANPRLVEETAVEMREALARFLKNTEA
jgi:UDPglucose--hexose-1-phosphate uridylyltransferase